MFMAQWLWKNKQDEYDMIFVFANTGQENEETLVFIDKFEKHFGIKVVWIEAITNPKNGIGQTCKVVDFTTASRNGTPFEAVIAKHGIPNTQTPHCTRDLKQRPIEKYAKSIGWKNYYTAIGIREDECDRINRKAREKKLMYPLISMIPMTKPKINFWWSQQLFRLNLKGYQGNCKWCWKKSHYKLYTIAKENPEAFDFPEAMENKYGNYVPATRLKKIQKRGEVPNLPTRFFRGNKSVADIKNEAKKWDGTVVDDSRNNDLVGGESCEIYSSCGD